MPPKAQKSSKVSKSTDEPKYTKPQRATHATMYKQFGKELENNSQFWIEKYRSKWEEAKRMDEEDAKNEELVKSINVFEGHYENDLMHLHRIQCAYEICDEIAGLAIDCRPKGIDRDHVIRNEQFRCLISESACDHQEAYDMMRKGLMDDSCCIDDWVIPEARKVLEFIREQF